MTVDWLGVALAALTAGLCARRGRRSDRLAWALLAGAAGAFALGTLAHLAFDSAELSTDIGLDAADAGLLLCPVLFALGALQLGLRRDRAVNKVTVISQGALVLSSLWSLAWEGALQWVAPAPAPLSGHVLLLIVQPMLDVVALACAVVALVHRRRRELHQLLAIVLLLTAADCAGALSSSGRFDLTPRVATLVHLGAFLLLAQAATQPASADDGQAPVFAARSLLVYGPLALVVIASVIEQLASVPNTAASQILVSAMGASIAFNEVTTYIENNRLKVDLEDRLVALSRNEERHRLVVDTMSDAVVVIDRLGVLREVSKRWTDITGWSVEESIGHNLVEYAHPNELPANVARFGSVIDGGVEMQFNTQVRRRDGQYRWVEVDAVNLFDVPQINGVLCCLRDVEARLQAAEELSRAEEQFRAAFSAAPIGMTVTDRFDVLLMVNDAFAAMLGYRASELVGRSIAELTVLEDQRRVKAGLRQLDGTDRVRHTDEQRYLHREGGFVYGSVSLSVVNDKFGDEMIIAQIEDVTERREIAARLEYAARHDDVTGLFNRQHFMARLAGALGGLDEGHGLAVLFLDLDRFKIVNDSLGHAVGDDLLRFVARRLVAGIRSTDLVARFGGDEFTILVDPVTSEEAVLELAQRLVESLVSPVRLPSGELYVTASIGVAFADRAGVSADDLIRNADAAMYRAKERGRNRIERFDQESLASAVRDLRTGNDLHRAITRNEIEVHYQPVVSIGGGAITGFEALVRWRHPERGVVMPSDFIPLAEDTGLVVPIGEMVLCEALAQLARWHERFANPTLTMSVNLSARQLADPNLLEVIGSAISRARVAPDRVWLEITESALMTDIKASELMLRALSRLGVRMTVDDFGTGYASLTYLKRFPVQGLKIDRSFVDGLGTLDDDDAIVEAVVRLGRSLGLIVVGEGVETEMQLAYLGALGCDYAQGYLFSAAVPADEVDGLMANQRVRTARPVEGSPIL